MAADPSPVPKDLRPLTLNRPVVPPSLPESFHPHPAPQASASAPRTCPAHAAPNGHADPAAAAAEDAWPDDQPSTAASRRVKFLCSFGGKILPRPSDGALRYVGGHTRIIAVRKDATFQDLLQKMVEVQGGPTVLKYQLPDEDLDALVTVSCAEDLENMMEEYDKLAAASPDGSAKMRVFLFSPGELESPVGFERGGVEFGQEAGQRYVEAVNGIVGEPGALKRKDSLASASSTQNSDVDFSVEPCLSEGTSPSHHQATTTTVLPDPSKLIYVNGLPKQSMMPPVGTPGGLQVAAPQTPATVQLEQLPPLPSVPSYVPQQEAINIVKYPQNHGQHIQYIPQNLGLGGVAPVGYVAVPTNSFVPGMQITAPPTSQLPQISHPKPVQARPESYLEENPYGGKIVPPLNDANSKLPYQPLSQFPPLTPPSLQAPNADRFPGAYVWPAGLHPPHAPHGHALMLDDCLMCQKALPHVHSDTSVLDHRTSNAGASAEPNPPYHSLQPEDAMSYTAPHKVATATPINDAKNQGVGLGATTMTPQAVTHFPKAQNDTATQLLAEFPEPHKGMFPPGGAAYYGDLLSLCAMPSSQQPLAHPGGQLQNQLPSSISPVHYPGQQDLVTNKVVPVTSRNQPPSNLVPGQYPLSQGVLLNQVNFMDTVSPRNQVPQNFDAPFQEAVNQLSDVPAAPIGGIAESLCVSPETSGIYEQQKITGNPEGSRMKDMKPESPPKISKPNDITKPQLGGKDLLMGNDLIKTGLPEGRPSVPVEQLLPSTAAVTTLIGMPSSSQLPPLLGDPVSTGFQDVGIAASNPPLPHKLLLAVPNPANKSPTGVWREQDSHFPSRSLIDDVPAMQTANVVGPSPSSAIPNLKAVETHVPAHVDSIFNSPNLQGAQALPVSPKKEAKGETLAAKDLGPESYTKNNGATGGKGNYQIQTEVNKDSFPECIPSNKDGKIQQEMQALSEAVAESVLQSPVPHTAVSTVVDRSALDPSFSTMGPDKSIDLPIKEPKTALLDKLNLGFQITEDMERLQVIKNSDLEELRELGSGTFGTVYHGKWRGTDVAIKRINDRCFAGKASDQERLRADFWNEACNLAGLHHPNVVAFYGVVLDGPGGSFATVTEYMVNGSLRNALQRSDRVLDWRKRLLIAMDAAFGMEYLHGKKIVHFDLKSDNLLVNLRDPHRPICKVGDLGLSKVKCQTLISGGVRGTLPWMAPELLNGGSSRVSEKVDVFSFGIVMWEILTGEEPYADLHYGAIIGGIVSNTLRPPVPESCDPEWKSLMERCWSAEPTERPTFTEIAAKLRAMSASLPPKGPSQASHSPASSQAQR